MLHIVTEVPTYSFPFKSLRNARILWKLMLGWKKAANTLRSISQRNTRRNEGGWLLPVCGQAVPVVSAHELAGGFATVSLSTFSVLPVQSAGWHLSVHEINYL